MFSSFFPPLVRFLDPITDRRCLYRGVNISYQSNIFPTDQLEGETRPVIVLVSGTLCSQCSHYTLLPYTNPPQAGTTHRAKQVATLSFPLAKHFKSWIEMRLHSHLHHFLCLSKSEIELSLLSRSAKPIPSCTWPRWINWFDLTPTKYNWPQKTREANVLFSFQRFLKSHLPCAPNYFQISQFSDTK